MHLREESPLTKELTMTHSTQPIDPLAAAAQAADSAGLRCPWQQALAALSFGILAAVCSAPVLIGGTGASTARDHALPDPARFAGSKLEGDLKPRRLLGWRLFRRNLRPHASA